MGLSASSPEGEGSKNDEYKEFPVGYRILGIQRNAPSCEKFVPFLDFIVAANSVRLKADDKTFYKMIEDSEDQPLELSIFNTKNRETRKVVCQPNRRWGGAGLLGMTIKFDTFEDADEAVFHILEVEPNSPAATAGLLPYDDFILGTPRHILTSLDELNELLNDNLNNPCEFFVYSQSTDVVRTTVIKPTLGWGGKGCLGCGVGHGYLHRLPKTTRHSTGTGREEDYLSIKVQQGLVDENAHNQVDTPLGPGEIYGEKSDGRRVVKLHWGLAHQATAIAFFRAENVRVPQTAQ